jgi:hypothetical protein
MSRKFIPCILCVTTIPIIFVFLISISFPGTSQDSETTPGPYLSLALKAPLTPTPTPTHTATPSYGVLLISEVMLHSSGIEPDSEWVELYNSGGATLNLSTYKLGDEETRGQGEGMLVFPSGASLAPGQVIVIANKAANFITVLVFTPIMK